MGLEIQARQRLLSYSTVPPKQLLCDGGHQWLYSGIISFRVRNLSSRRAFGAQSKGRDCKQTFIDSTKLLCDNELIGK